VGEAVVADKEVIRWKKDQQTNWKNNEIQIFCRVKLCFFAAVFNCIFTKSALILFKLDCNFLNYFPACEVKMEIKQEEPDSPTNLPPSPSSSSSSINGLSSVEAWGLNHVEPKVKCVEMPSKMRNVSVRTAGSCPT